MTYDEFIKAKVVIAHDDGLQIEPGMDLDNSVGALLPSEQLAHGIEFNRGFVELCRLHNVKAAYIMADTTDAKGRTRLIGGGDQDIDAFLTRLLRSAA